MKSGFSGAASDPNTFFGRFTPTLFVPLQDEDRVDARHNAHSSTATSSTLNLA